MNAGALVIDGGSIDSGGTVNFGANTSMIITNGGTVKTAGDVALNNNVSDVNVWIIGGGATSSWDLGNKIPRLILFHHHMKFHALQLLLLYYN